MKTEEKLNVDKTLTAKVDKTDKTDKTDNKVDEDLILKELMNEDTKEEIKNSIK